jgi:hypothetical protein
MGDKLRLAVAKFAYEGHHDDKEVMEPSNFRFTESVPTWGSIVSIGETSMTSLMSPQPICSTCYGLFGHVLCAIQAIIQNAVGMAVSIVNNPRVRVIGTIPPKLHDRSYVNIHMYKTVIGSTRLLSRAKNQP